MLPMTEFQFRLHVEPLLKWDSLNAEVRTYLEQQGDSIDLQPIIVRYTAAVREFYKWFWLKFDERMKPDRIESDPRQLLQEGPGQRKRSRAWALLFQQLRQQ